MSPREAIATRAERLYLDLDRDQEELKRLLLVLARPGAGSEVTLHRPPYAYLVNKCPHASDIVRKLRDARLVRLYHNDGGVLPAVREPDPNSLVELVHTAVVTKWPRAQEWLDEERPQIHSRLDLAEMARHWDKQGRDPRLLLRGSLLPKARKYTDLTDLEDDYVRASVAAYKEERLQLSEQEESGEDTSGLRKMLGKDTSVRDSIAAGGLAPVDIEEEIRLTEMFGSKTRS